MVQPPPFSEQDTLFPVYCIDCRAHIPTALSNTLGGRCAPCANAHANSVNAKKADDDLNVVLKRYRAAGFRATSTPCRYCKEGPLWVKSEVQSKSGLRILGYLFAAGLLFCGVIVHWLVALVAICIGVAFMFLSDRNGPTICACQSCGQQYTL
jgi:hypothetical protein